MFPLIVMWNINYLVLWPPKTPLRTNEKHFQLLMHITLWWPFLSLYHFYKILKLVIDKKLYIINNKKSAPAGPFWRASPFFLKLKGVKHSLFNKCLVRTIFGQISAPKFYFSREVYTWSHFYFTKNNIRSFIKQ